jgi:integrase
VPATSSQPTPGTAPPACASVRKQAKAKEQLPRGIRRRGHSLIVFITHPDGRSERRSLGNVTLKFAKEQRSIWQREIAEGRYVKKVPRTERPLYSVIADKALEHAKNYKRCHDADQSRIELMKLWWGDRLADSITTEEIDAKLLETRKARNWTETTSNEYRITLLRVFKLAIDQGEVTTNPAQKAHRYKLNNARTRVLSLEEEARLRAAILQKYPHKIWEFDLALHCGCRRSNLYGIHTKGRKPMAGLNWENVDFIFKVIRFPRAKGGDGYTVPLNSVALAALRKLRERSDGTGPVIRKPGGREIFSCRKWFENCLDLAKVEGFRYHDLRHTFGTRLRRNGVPLEDIAALLDHEIPELRMTKRYAHVDIDRLRKAVATLEPGTSTKTDTAPVVEFPKAEAV